MGEQRIVNIADLKMSAEPQPTLNLFGRVTPTDDYDGEDVAGVDGKS